MATRGKRYSATFKTKVILELLEGEHTLNQIASKYGITPKSLLSWKSTFLANASLAFDIENAVSEYKTELEAKEKEVSELHRQLGKRTVEAEWLQKKLMSLDFDLRRKLIDSKHDHLSTVRQCELLAVNRSTYYYQSQANMSEKLALLRAIDDIYTAVPFYGYRKVHKALLSQGYAIGLNRVNHYMRELGLKTIYPTKKVKTTLAKYPWMVRVGQQITLPLNGFGVVLNKKTSTSMNIRTLRNSEQAWLNILSFTTISDSIKLYIIKNQWRSIKIA